VAHPSASKVSRAARKTVGRGRPLRLGEFLGETPRLVGRRQRHVPVAEAGGHARVKGQQPRQMPESSLGA